jgi:ribosome biogenesis GTPase
VPEERYQNYIKIKKESNYNDMSYLEKKQKDKQFGKLIKSVMKQKKNQR